MRMYDGPAIATMLPALFDEAVAPVRILGDHDECAVLEAALALQVPAEQVEMLVLRGYAHALLSLDLGVETARADPEVHRGTGLGEQLPRILGDEDPALADIFGAETVAVGATRNAHSVALFSHIAGLLCRPRSGRLRSAQAGAGIVQKPHQMHHWDLRARGAQPRRDLEDAARVGRDDEVGARGEDRRDLLALQLGRDVRMRQVVDARAAATPFRVVDRHDGHVRHRREQRARLTADLLTVDQVAGVLVDDADLARRAGPHRGRRDRFRRIAHPRAERTSALLPRR